MKKPGCALVLAATVACGGSRAPQPTVATPVAHPPAIVGLQTYLSGSVSSFVDFIVIDLDGEEVRWAATVATAPGCRCSAGPLRLAYIDQQPAGSGVAPSGMAASGTRLRLIYYPGGNTAPNHVLVTITASDSGATTSATIEVPNW